MKIEIKAYSKVNLHLEILNNRGDGYHNIFSLNASVDLYDEIIINKIKIIDDPGKDILIELIPAGGRSLKQVKPISLDDNLITKAVKAYLNKIEKSGEISISFKKDIPVGAGLGGGSSDAAAVLKALDRNLSTLGNNVLSKLGSKLGADVPYCLSGGFAVCQGIGDEIDKIDGNLGHIVLIFKSENQIDTAWAYRSLNRQRNLAGQTIEKIQEKINLFKEKIKKGTLNGLIPLFKNDFEELVFAKYQDLRIVKEKMRDFGAVYSTMTGSGSSIIGLFDDLESAEAAKMDLSNYGELYITRFIT